MEQNSLSNFDKEYLRNILCNYLEIDPLFRRRSSLKVFSIFSSGSHFVKRSGMV